MATSSNHHALTHQVDRADRHSPHHHTSTSNSPPTLRGVLVTNDDGHTNKHAPFLVPFTRYLHQYLQSTSQSKPIPLLVCVPAQQQSWSGKAITRHSNITVSKNFTADNWQQLVEKQAQLAQQNDDSTPASQLADAPLWGTVNGSPATTANVGIYTLAPCNIDLVISGPNLGRNTGRANVTSSGTIAAAAEAAMGGTKSIALSYGFTGGYGKGITEESVRRTTKATLEVIDRLWQNWPVGVDLVNINVAVDKPLSGEVWITRLFRDYYGGIYEYNKAGRSRSPSPKRVSDSSDAKQSSASKTSNTVVNADPTAKQENIHPQHIDNINADQVAPMLPPESMAFAVDFSADVTKQPDYVGSDLWALKEGHISVTGMCVTNGLHDIDFDFGGQAATNEHTQKASAEQIHSRQVMKLSSKL